MCAHLGELRAHERTHAPLPQRGLRVRVAPRPCLGPARRPPSLPRATPQDLPQPQLPDDVTAAFDTAYNNIRAFHEAQKGGEISVETMPGVRCRRVARAINAGEATGAGAWAPGAGRGVGRER